MLLKLLSFLIAAHALASEPNRMQALRFMERLTGIRPHHEHFSATVDEVAVLLEQGNLRQAAEATLRSTPLEKAFLELTVQDWATRFTNMEQSSFSAIQGLEK